MASNSTDELAQWLARTQNYSTNPEALNRIGGSVDGLNVALRGLDTDSPDSLFGTEPSNLEMVLVKDEDSNE